MCSSVVFHVKVAQKEWKLKISPIPMFFWVDVQFLQIFIVHGEKFLENAQLIWSSWQVWQAFSNVKLIRVKNLTFRISKKPFQVKNTYQHKSWLKDDTKFCHLCLMHTQQHRSIEIPLLDLKCKKDTVSVKVLECGNEEKFLKMLKWVGVHVQAFSDVKLIRIKNHTFRISKKPFQRENTYQHKSGLTDDTQFGHLCLLCMLDCHQSNLLLL